MLGELSLLINRVEANSSRMNLNIAYTVKNIKIYNL